MYHFLPLFLEHCGNGVLLKVVVCWKSNIETSSGTLWYEEYFKKLTSSYICMSDLMSCVFKKGKNKNEETYF